MKKLFQNKKIMGAIGAILLVLMGDVVSPTGDALNSNPPQPVLIQYDGQTYFLGVQKNGKLSAEEAREVAINIMSLIISQTTDEGMQAVMDEIGFNGPRQVQGQVNNNPLLPVVDPPVDPPVN